MGLSRVLRAQVRGIRGNQGKLPEMMGKAMGNTRFFPMKYGDSMYFSTLEHRLDNEIYIYEMIQVFGPGKKHGYKGIRLEGLLESRWKRPLPDKS